MVISDDGNFLAIVDTSRYLTGYIDSFFDDNNRDSLVTG